MSSEVAGSLYYDRLSGRGARLPETKGTLVGRWVLRPNKGSDVFLNSAPVVRGDFLVPEASGLWCVLEPAGQRTEGSVTRMQLPEDLEAESIRTIGERLANFKAERKNWLDWTDVVPLVPGMSDEVEIKPLDQKIREHFGHLEAVCFKPRAHLHVEVERVPVSKARRIAPAAAAYLASHTEDWDRPLIRGILPKRILSEVRHDQIDIYENRVTARLLDHLTVYLVRRIQKLRKLLKMFQEKEVYTSGTGGTYQRQQRIMALWGESIDANEGRRKAEATLKELDWLKYKLMGLVDSPLYRSVPRRSYVPTTLRMTNILANDQHYRRVCELWREWADTGAGHIKSPQELNAEAQDLCRGMDSFSMLLVVRALEMLGYEPQSADWETALTPGTTIRVEGHGASLSARWQVDGTILIQTEDDSLRFLPLAFDLGGANNEEQAQAALDRICDGALKTSSKLAVLYAASEEANEKLSLKVRLALHTVGNDPRTVVSEVGVLPVSPWEIGSTERVARALRWFITSARFNGYPWTIDVQPQALTGFAFEKAKWLARTNGGRSIELLRPPQDYEWKQFNVGSVVANAEAALKTAQQSHEEMSQALKRAEKSGTKKGDLDRRKREAKQAIVKAQTGLEATKIVAEELLENHSRWIALLQCPTCGKSANATRDFEPRDHGCFKCHCPGCKTAWGTRLCGAGHKYAVMLPSGDLVDTEDTEPGWEDRVYGGDLLALPARKENDEWGFACPECGEVT